VQVIEKPERGSQNDIGNINAVDPVSHHHALPSTATAFGILSGIRVD
jgi:hypothetical protein